MYLWANVLPDALAVDMVRTGNSGFSTEAQMSIDDVWRRFRVGQCTDSCTLAVRARKGEQLNSRAQTIRHAWISE